MTLFQTRWLMYEQGITSVSMPLLVVLVLWLSLILGSFGLFAPVNGTVIASLCVCALSISAAIFLILEMYSPFSGMIPALQRSAASRPRAPRPVVARFPIPS